jgi:hypothetical protein
MRNISYIPIMKFIRPRELSTKITVDIKEKSAKVFQLEDGIYKKINDAKNNNLTLKSIIEPHQLNYTSGQRLHKNNKVGLPD